MPGKSEDIAKAVTLAKDVLAIIDEHPEIVDRLEAGTRDQLARDYALLGGETSGTAIARRDVKLSTGDERSIAKAATAIITNLRQAIGHSSLDKATQRKWGVGMRLDARLNKTVIDGAQAILDRGRTTAGASELTSAGGKTSDLDTLAAQIARLTPADQTQAGQKKASKTATRSEQDAVDRVYAAARRVGSAGVLEHHVSDPDTAAEFQAIVDRGSKPSNQRKPKAKPAPTATK